MRQLRFTVFLELFGSMQESRTANYLDHVDKVTFFAGNQLLTISPSFLRIESGHTASFYCNVTAMFDPMDTDDFGVEWRRNGERLSSSGRIKETTRYTLQINGVTRLDQGMYQCFVSDKTGWLQATAELHIGGRFKISNFISGVCRATFESESSSFFVSFSRGVLFGGGLSDREVRRPTTTGGQIEN